MKGEVKTATELHWQADGKQVYYSTVLRAMVLIDNAFAVAGNETKSSIRINRKRKYVLLANIKIGE